MSGAILNLLGLGAVLTLSGCWTTPVAEVQPKGAARLIETGLIVESVKDAAIVRSIDAGHGTIVLCTPGVETSTYMVDGPMLLKLNAIKAGDVVAATVTEELTVYLLHDGKLPGPAGESQEITADARVLTVDVSYRRLTLQYLNHQTETFKVPLGTKLSQMAAGDSVVIRSLLLLDLRRKG